MSNNQNKTENLPRLHKPADEPGVIGDRWAEEHGANVEADAAVNPDAVILPEDEYVVGKRAISSEVRYAAHELLKHAAAEE